jgi:hypothetical protein
MQDKQQEVKEEVQQFDFSANGGIQGLRTGPNRLTACYTPLGQSVARPALALLNATPPF